MIMVSPYQKMTVEGDAGENVFIIHPNSKFTEQEGGRSTVITTKNIVSFSKGSSQFARL